MKIAMEGFMHGELDTVYATLLDLEQKENNKIDLFPCCGDFQAERNEIDLESLNVPRKYKRMGSFWKYYSGESAAPIPTMFIGGNHEASNHLWELYYGGWAAPNIYFLGFSGVVKFGNVRIGGLSGIYKKHHYRLGHYERPPYTESDIPFIYHVREYEVHKLMRVKEPVDIFLSHDWPIGVTDHRNKSELLRYKSYFAEEIIIESKTLGSKPASQLLKTLNPLTGFQLTYIAGLQLWFNTGRVIEIESEPGPYTICYDEEWLAVTRELNSLIPLTRRPAHFGFIQPDIGAEPFDFVRTVPCHNQPGSNSSQSELPNLLDESKLTSSVQAPSPTASAYTVADVVDHNDEEIPLGDLGDCESD